MRILVAMSGGVDSSVAALLLKQQGHEIEGVYMKNWINEDEILGECPWEQDIVDARAAAEAIGIPFHVENFIGEYRDRVVAYLLEGYRTGITPNPDVMCNREMKFGVLLDYALAHGFERVATGHYCQRRDNPDGTADILEGADKNKDQSYFLALLGQHQVSRACFPIGHLLKPELREIARRHGLPNSDKKDSQGICFIGQVKMGDFLDAYLERKPGDIVDTLGHRRGRHNGLHLYTLGQRKGIGVPSNADNEFFVVVGKDWEKNQLIIAFESQAHEAGLYGTHFRLHHASWTNRVPTLPARLLAKPRYRDPSTPVQVTPLPDGSLDIVFDVPQRAITGGQVCALYDGETLLGGGIYF